MDNELVRRFRNGDESAFDSLFSRYKDRVYGLVCRTVPPQDSDDVVQEAFVRIYKSLRRFRGESSVSTWIFRVALNTCYDHLRRKGRRPDEVVLDESIEGNAGNEPTDYWTRDALEHGMNLLPTPERLVVEMHYIQEMSYSEIAETLDCPQGTVKTRVHSAISKLRQHLLPLLDGVSK